MTSASARLTLVNKRGLHARASNKFMECVLRYRAKVHVRSHNDTCAEKVEADSVMELLLLGSAYGEDITVEAEGPEAENVVEALTKLVNEGFLELEDE